MSRDDETKRTIIYKWQIIEEVYGSGKKDFKLSN